jgi:hypothetical protein
MATGAVRAIHAVSERARSLLVIEVISLLAVICNQNKE